MFTREVWPIESVSESRKCFTGELVVATRNEVRKRVEEKEKSNSSQVLYLHSSILTPSLFPYPVVTAIPSLSHPFRIREIKLK